MARTVYVPEAGGALDFPDGTSDQQIVDFVRAKYAPPALAPAPDTGVPERGLLNALKYGAQKSLGAAEAGLGGAAEGIESLFGTGSSASDYLYNKATENLNEGGKYQAGEIWGAPSWSEMGYNTLENIAQSLPESLAVMAGSEVGRLGGLPGRIAGGAVVGGILAAGHNMERQALEQGKTLKETNAGTAYLAAVPQGLLDSLSNELMLRGVLSPMPKRAIGQTILRAAESGAGRIAIATGGEAVTETLQQAIEIGQANPEKLFSMPPDVQRELLDAATVGGIFGGAVHAVSMPFQSTAEGIEAKTQDQLRSDVISKAQEGEQLKRNAEINSGVENLSRQETIGDLKLGKVQIDPTPDNGLSEPITRFQILDNKNSSIAEFSDPVHATDAVNIYSKLSGKKIKLTGINNGKLEEIPTVNPVGKVSPSKAFPKTTPIVAPGTEPSVSPIAPAPTQTSPALPRKMAQIVKKADIATRMQPVPAADIPYESVMWDNTKKAAVPVSGKSKIVDYGGRKMVVVDVNGTNVPFYLSTGAAGKTNVPAGKWYPFFGIGPDGWINKTSQEEIANYYGDEDLKRVSQTLDATVGDIRGNQSIPRIGLNGSHISFINSGLEPSDNGASYTADKVNQNIKKVLEKIRANKPVEQIADEEALVEQPSVADESGSGKRIERSSGGGTALQYPDYQSYLNAVRATGFNDEEIAKTTGINNEQDFLNLRELEIQEYVEQPAQDAVRRVYAKGGTPFSSNAFGPGRKGVEYEDVNGKTSFEPLTEGELLSAQRQGAFVDNEPVGAADRAPASEAYAVTEEAINPPSPDTAEFDARIVMPTVDAAGQEAVRQKINERKTAIAEGVREALKRYNLKDVETKLVPAIVDKLGKVMAAEGSATVSNDKSFINLSINIYDPKSTVEDMVTRVVDALNHESIHSLFDLSLLRPAEKQMLLNAVETAKVPGKSYTYLDYAKVVYDPKRPGLEHYADPNLVREEAVAEMFRDWRKKQAGAPKGIRGLINRVFDVLRHIFNSMRRNNYEAIFSDIQSGKVGLRERSPVAESGMQKFSAAPDTKNAEFKEWFKDSKVTNFNGEPLVVYHGTPKFNGDRFHYNNTKVNRSGNVSGFYFTSNTDRANGYTEDWRNPEKLDGALVIPAYLSIQNPFVRGRSIPTPEMGDAYKEELIKENNHLSGTNSWFNEKVDEMYRRGDITSSSLNGDGDAMQRVYRAGGFDGVIDGTEYIAFDPVQVKSSFNKFGPGTAEDEKFVLYPELPDLSVAPTYPFGQRVPQIRAADTNRVLEQVEYAVIVNNISNLFGSRVLNAIIPDKLKPSFEGTTDFFLKWVDRRLGMAQTVDFVKANGGTVPDALDFYAVAVLSDGVIAEKLRERTDGIYKDLIGAIKNGGLSFEEFDKYAYAKHAPERNDRMRQITPEKIDPNTGQKIPHPDNFGSGMSYKEANDIVTAAESGPKAEAYKKAYNAYRAIIADTNALRVEGGLSEDFDNMVVEDEYGNKFQLDTWKNYAPLRGFAEEHDVDGDLSPEMQARLGQGFKIKGREDRRALGRTSKASDIIAHTLLQNQEAVIRVEKNKVGQSLLALIQENPKLMKDYGVEVIGDSNKPMKKYVSSSGVIKTVIDPTYKNRDDVFVVKVGGREVAIKVDNRFLQRSLINNKTSSPSLNSGALRFLAGMNRFLAATNTVWNLEFPLVNFPRDLQQAALNLTQYDIKGLRRKVLKDAIFAVKDVFKSMRNPEVKNQWSDWYDEFRRNGGQTSGFYGAFTIEEQLRKMDKMAMEVSGSPSSRAKKAIDSALGIVGDFNGAFENAVRLSIYKNVRELGGTPQKAAFLAKNTTINFDQRGEKGAVANALYLFFNASVQGTAALGLAAARSSKVRKAIGALVAFGVIQDLINAKMSDEGDDGELLYDKIPDYELENNIVVVDPFGIMDKGYFSLPLAYGANAFVNLGRALSRTFRGGYTSSKALNSIGWTFVDAFNPVGGTESFLNFVTPTSLDWFVSLAQNNDFTGRKIYPTAFPGSTPKANSQTYFSSTSPSAVWIAEKLNSLTGGGEYVPGYISIKPDVLEYMYDYALGAAGATARRAFDAATTDLPALLRGDLQSIDINNVPVLRKLVGNVSERIQFDDYADKVNYILTRGEEYKFALKEGDKLRIQEVREKYKDELSIYPQIKALVNSRNQIASDLRKIKDNTKMPPELKRQRQEALQKQMQDIMSRVNKLYQEKIGNKYPKLLS